MNPVSLLFLAAWPEFTQPNVQLLAQLCLLGHYIFMQISISRSRFLPVKKSSDLLLIMSNLYSLSNGALKMSPDRMFQTTPLIKLGDQNFKKVNEFLQRFGSIPGTIGQLQSTVLQDFINFWLGFDTFGPDIINIWPVVIKFWSDLITVKRLSLISTHLTF